MIGRPKQRMSESAGLDGVYVTITMRYEELVMHG